MIEEKTTQYDFKTKKMEKLIVDLLNILYEDRDIEGKLKVENIKKIQDYLLKKGYEPILIVDASAMYMMDNEEVYKTLVNDKIVYQAPAGKKADIFFLKLAKIHKCNFLTNDCCKDYYKKYGKEWIIKHRKTYMFIGGELILE